MTTNLLISGNRVGDVDLAEDSVTEHLLLLQQLLLDTLGQEAVASLED